MLKDKQIIWSQATLPTEKWFQYFDLPEMDVKKLHIEIQSSRKSFLKEK